jgi:hypothetical protein
MLTYEFSWLRNLGTHPLPSSKFYCRWFVDGCYPRVGSDARVGKTHRKTKHFCHESVTFKARHAQSAAPSIVHQHRSSLFDDGVAKLHCQFRLSSAVRRREAGNGRLQPLRKPLHTHRLLSRAGMVNSDPSQDAINCSAGIGGIEPSFTTSDPVQKR